MEKSNSSFVLFQKNEILNIILRCKQNKCFILCNVLLEVCICIYNTPVLPFFFKSFLKAVFEEG